MPTGQLFPKDAAPRAPRKVLMHVYDAGGEASPLVKMRCRKCGHDTGWVEMDGPVSEYKRGLPCPLCN